MDAPPDPALEGWEPGSCAPEGDYILKCDRLTDQRNGTTIYTKNGDRMLNWEFHIVERDDGVPIGAGRRLFTNSTLTRKAQFTYKPIYKAFGFTGDTAFRDFYGQYARAHLVPVKQTMGKRAGQMQEQVVEWYPYTGEIIPKNDDETDLGDLAKPPMDEDVPMPDAPPDDDTPDSEPPF